MLKLMKEYFVKAGTRGCLRAAHAAGLSTWVASVDKNTVTVAPYNET